MEHVARLALQRVAGRTDLPLALSITTPALAAALDAALGERQASGGPGVAGAVVSLGATDGWCPAAARAAILQVAPGDRVVAVFVHGAGDRSVEALAETWRPLLDLERARGERAGEGVVLVSGPRRAALGGPERKRLRGLGHAMDPTVLVGRAGVTPELVAAARAALGRHGLIKARMTPQCTLDKVEVADELRWGTGSHLVQRVGRTALLWAPGVPLEPPVNRRRRR